MAERSFRLGDVLLKFVPRRHGNGMIVAGCDARVGSRKALGRAVGNWNA